VGGPIFVLNRHRIGSLQWSGLKALLQIYNVATREERLAIAAVKRVARDPHRALVKIKSKLTKQLFAALKMQAGDVMLGARKKRHRDVN
jgi:hypothetical protein